MQMQSFILAAFASTIPFIAASPLDKRGDQGQYPTGTLTICTDANFGGDCTVLTTPYGECVNFPTGFQWDVSSLKPQPGFSCDLYYVSDCNINSGSFFAPWTEDFSTLTQGNDAFVSTTCYTGPA